MISAIMYLVTCTYPDLTFCVCYISQFSFHSPNFYHTAVKRVFHYISGSCSYILIYPHSGYIKLKGFLDASFANWLDTHYSYTSYIF